MNKSDALKTLTFDLKTNAGSWTVRGPNGSYRRIESPLADEGFRELTKSLRDWASRPVRSTDELNTEVFIEELAHRVSLKLTEALLKGPDRRFVVDALTEENLVRLVVRVRAAAETWNHEADHTLALPWELLAPEAPAGYPVRDGRLSIIREAVTDHAPGLKEPSAPLTLAVILAAPEDRPSFPYEQESFRLFKALSPLGRRAVFTDLGGLDDLIDLVAGVRASAVHFRGHGSPGSLLFEDDLGFADEAPISELQRRLAAVLLAPSRADAFPGLFFLAAPFTAREADEAACAAALHRAGFAQVIGFFGPVDAELNTRLEERFYTELAKGRSTLEAAEEARTALTEPTTETGEQVRYPFGWCQLAVYHRGDDLPLARPDRGEAITLSERSHVVVSGLPVLEHGFIGRRGLQHEIRRRVERDGGRVVVIQGLGGLGKTALAGRLLAYAFAPNSKDRLVLRCRDLGEHPILELRVQAEQHGRLHDLPSWEQRVKDLRERIPNPIFGLVELLRMIRRERPNLVVYVDNAETLQSGPSTEDPSVLGDWKPGLERWWSQMERFARDEDCLLLATTRYAWKGLSPRAHFGIPPMGAVDSLRLLDSFEALRRLPYGVRTRLAERVDGHPRTVEILAGLIGEQSQTIRPDSDTWNDMIAPLLPAQEEKIRGDLLLEILWKRISRQAREHLQRLTVLRRPTRQSIIDQLGGARDELIRTGWLTRFREQIFYEKETRWANHWGLQGITSDFLATVCNEELVQQGRRAAADAFENATLEDTHLRTDQSEAVYHLHACGEGDRSWPIVRDYVLWLRDTARYNEALDVLKCCEEAKTTGDRLAAALVMQMQMRSFIGHSGDELITALDRALELAATPESRSAALQEKSDVLSNLGRFEAAEELLRNLLKTDEEDFGTNHPSYVATLYALAVTVDRQGRHREAESLLRDAMKHLDQTSLDENHSSREAIYHALAGALKEQDRLVDAETAILRSLDYKSEDHPDYASSLHTLAQILEKQGRYQEAETTLRKSLAVFEPVFGEQHPLRATILNSLAVVAARQGKDQESERLARLGLALTDATLGVDHFEYGLSLQVVASALEAQGKYQDAEEEIRRALSVQEAVLRRDHPDLLPTLQTLGAVYLRRSRFEEAEEVFRRSVALASRALGNRHSLYSSALQNLAVVLRNTGRLDEAESLLRQALEIEDAPTTLFNLAQVLDDQGRLEEAEALIRRCLEIEEKTLGTDHPQYISTLQESALILAGQGRLEQALEALRNSTRLQIRRMGEEHPETFAPRINEASFLLEMGDLEEAEEVLQELAQIIQSSPERSPEHVVRVLSKTAEAQYLLGRPEAPGTARRALDLIHASFGPDHHITEQLSEDLERIADGDFDQDELPSLEEVMQLEADVARARTGGRKSKADLRDRLDDLAFAFVQIGRRREAAAAMEEVVALDQELDHPDLKWDQRFLQQIIEIAETAEADDSRSQSNS